MFNCVTIMYYSVSATPVAQPLLPNTWLPSSSLGSVHAKTQPTITEQYIDENPHGNTVSRLHRASTIISNNSTSLRSSSVRLLSQTPLVISVPSDINVGRSIVITGGTGVGMIQNDID